MNKARGITLYKYLNYDGAKKTLENRTLKLSSSSVFNDPFDMKLEEALGLPIDEFADQLMPALFKFLCSDIDHSKVRKNAMGYKIILMNQSLRTASKEKLDAVKEKIFSLPIKGILDIDALRQSDQTLVDKLRNDFHGSGVFCTSRNKESLLMWSHYADHHRGVVFEFLPSEARDSALLISRPVKYTRDRPLIYRTQEDLIRSAIMMPILESVKHITENLIYTKSVEWQYEEEYRLVIPEFVPNQKTNEMLSFYPEELVAVHFGCRIEQYHKNELTKLARSLNPKAHLYQATMARREYALEWERILCT